MTSIADFGDDQSALEYRGPDYRYGIVWLDGKLTRDRETAELLVGCTYGAVKTVMRNYANAGDFAALQPSVHPKHGRFSCVIHSKRGDLRVYVSRSNDTARRKVQELGKLLTA